MQSDLYTYQKQPIRIYSIYTGDAFPAIVVVLKCLITACPIHNFFVSAAVKISLRAYVSIFTTKTT